MGIMSKYSIVNNIEMLNQKLSETKDPEKMQRILAQIDKLYEAVGRLHHEELKVKLAHDQK